MDDDEEGEEVEGGDDDDRDGDSIRINRVSTKE